MRAELLPALFRSVYRSGVGFLPLGPMATPGAFGAKRTAWGGALLFGSLAGSRKGPRSGAGPRAGTHVVLTTGLGPRYKLRRVPAAF